jgi:hypothetical protein
MPIISFFEGEENIGIFGGIRKRKVEK